MFNSLMYPIISAPSAVIIILPIDFTLELQFEVLAQPIILCYTINRLSCVVLSLVVLV